MLSEKQKKAKIIGLFKIRFKETNYFLVLACFAFSAERVRA